jgi:hypothetical protein
VTAHTDLASTIMQLAGGSVPDTDGLPIPLTKESESESRHEHVTIEYWGLAIPEGVFGWYANNSMSDPGFYVPGNAAGNNTYKAIRIIGETYNLYYSVWCTGEKEFYDLKVSGQHRPSAFNSNITDYSLGGLGRDQEFTRRGASVGLLHSCRPLFRTDRTPS